MQPEDHASSWQAVGNAKMVHRRMKYPKKTKPKPDPDTFHHEREDGWSVGPKLQEIGGSERLLERIQSCETTSDWSFLLNDYISWGNNSKVANNVAIFNFNSAHDCPNLGTDNCQVEAEECYSHKDEEMYPYVLDYFRRQEYLWDCLDAQTWYEAFMLIVNRKHNPVRAVKFCQAGDFRHVGDIIKVNYIAEKLSKHGISAYTYSASNYLDWSKATSDNLVVNQSNSISDYGDRQYKVVENEAGMSEGTVWCPRDKQKHMGVKADDAIKCGECTLCITKEQGDIAVVKH